MYKKVRCHSASGLNFTPLQLIGLTPLWNITCGECNLTFNQRIPMVDEPGILCPHCHTINIIPVYTK
jgi:hypothetical protein